jgi:hypothetical protein
MVRIWLTMVSVLTAMAGPAVAQTSPLGPIGAAPPPVVAPSAMATSSVTTSRGPGLVTGTAGSPQMIMIPGSAVPGMLLNNGNGTSTVMTPGGVSQVVPTPR